MAKRILPLRVFYFASFAALGAFAPFFPRWLVARGVEGLALGLFLATLPAMAFIGPPLVGLLADLFDAHNKILRFTTLGAALSLVALGLVAGIGHGVTLVVLFALVLAHAAFRSPMAVMADVVAIEQAPKAGVSYARVRNWGSIGALAGAIGVGHVVNPQSPLAFPAAVAIPLFIALIASFALPAREQTPRAPLADEARALLASSDIPIFVGTAFVAEIALSSYDVGLALRLGELGASPGLVGAAWAVGVTSEIVLMACAGRLIDRFTPARLVLFALIVASIRCALLGSLRSLPLIAATQPLHALSTALFWISSISYVKARVAPHALASAQGLFAGVMAGGSVAGSLLWGTLYRSGGGRVVFGSASIVALGAAALATVWTTRAHEVRRVA